MKNPDSPKRGPKPETLVVEGDWQDAVKEALKKGKPPAKHPPRKSPPVAKNLTGAKKKRPPKG